MPLWLVSWHFHRANLCLGQGRASKALHWWFCKTRIVCAHFIGRYNYTGSPQHLTTSLSLINAVERRPRAGAGGSARTALDFPTSFLQISAYIRDIHPCRTPRASYSNCYHPRETPAKLGRTPLAVHIYIARSAFPKRATYVASFARSAAAGIGRHRPHACSRLRVHAHR